MTVYIVGILLFTNYFLGIYAYYHWKVTASGKISSQVENSGFPLMKQNDLLALLEQEHRLKTVNKLYEQLMFLERSVDRQWTKIEREGDLEKRLYSSDVDCILGKIPLDQHNLNTDFFDYGQSSRPKVKSNYTDVEPDCTIYSKLDFSMRTFPHLDTLNRKNYFNLSVTPVPSKSVINYNIDAMLRLNSSDWTAYNIASFYWRTLGNGTNALECAKRALYFSPRDQRYIVLLNLGTLLQELQSLGEAAIVLHSAVDHDPVQDISHLALGNVYAALGDYQRSLACYENVLSLNPENSRALQLKHAIICHKKLESGLSEIYSSLQKILKDLQKHNALHKEWLYLQNQINWERNTKVKEFFSLSEPLYLNLQMLLQNVEHQVRTLNEEVSRKVPRKYIKTVNYANGEFRNSNMKPIMKCEGHKKEIISVSSMNNLNKETCAKSENSIEESKEEEEESKLENFVSHKNKMNSLITFIKSNYEEDINSIDFKNKINDEFYFFGRKSHISFYRDFLVSDIDACVKDSSNVKKLN